MRIGQIPEKTAFFENHKPPSDGTKNTAHATMQLRPKITLTSRHRQSGAEMKILGSLYQTLRVKTALWINETITKQMKELRRDCLRSMERATPDSTPRIKFDSDEVNNLAGPKRVPSVSTPKRVGGGTTIHQQVLHPRVGELRGGNLHRGMSDNSF